MSDDTLYLLDLDRTLIDTDEFMVFTEEICSQIGINDSVVHQAYKQTREATIPAPYSPLETIKQNGGDKLAVFIDEFLDKATPERFLYPDAARFLQALNKRPRPYIILTYAVDEKWQQLKLQAAGLDNVPCIVTLNPYKGRDIANWQNDDGTFKVPVEGIESVQQLIFIDDRPRVFDDMPGSCKGFLIDRREDAKDEEISPNIVRIASFDEIIDKI